MRGLVNERILASKFLDSFMLEPLYALQWFEVSFIPRLDFQQ